MKPTHYKKKVLDLLECLRYLAIKESEELGTQYNSGCPTYSNGARTLHDRLWVNIIKDQWGGQQFTNDSFYRWVPNWDDLSEDENKFLVEFGSSKNEEDPDCREYDYFLFNVCW